VRAGGGGGGGTLDWRTGGGGTLDWRTGGDAEEPASLADAPGPEGGHSEDGRSAASEAVPSVTALLTWMTYPHLRHFIRTERPATFSSAI
jgi:hypothetical protein